MDVFSYGNENAELVLLQMTDDHELQGLAAEADLIREMSGADFCLLGCKTEDWNRDLSPWPAGPVFGSEAFGGKAGETLSAILNEIPPRYPGKTFILGGYSLAGLFALWAGYQTDLFKGAAAASPSVWFPGFTDYVREHSVRTRTVYLSLGDREEKTRNPVMSTVGDAIRSLSESYAQQENLVSVLEWNPGNHFKDPALRMAKAFAWSAMKVRS